MGFETGLPNKSIPSKPMPGLILEISVVVGQEVKEKRQFNYSGAMKRKQFLRADGIIKSISVATGDAVDVTSC
jgi:acetyl/propionyl-CoA carboxylase alpha subunit